MTVEEAYRAWKDGNAAVLLGSKWAITEVAWRAAWDAALAEAEKKCGDIAQAHYHKRGTPLVPEGDAKAAGAEQCEQAIASLRSEHGRGNPSPSGGA